MPEMISVSALNRYVRSILESDRNLADIVVKGEISNFTRNYKSGHCYFTLKDANAGVKAVMFRGEANTLNFQPESGMSVIVRCRVSLYERDGAFQLYVDAMFPEGVGLAQLAFEQLKTRLEEEGLFAPKNKKLIPAFPRCVGLITSKTGAALQDILQVAQRRCPDIQFLLAPVKVQGGDAAPEIIMSIDKLDTSGLVDTIIIARGGGSSEDLSVFNDEGIARAVYNCDTPVISAIGHEIDFTILDFVADLRAPTPSAAAELALPNLSDRLQDAERLFNNIQNNIQNKLELCYNNFSRCLRHPSLQNIRQKPSAASSRLRDMTLRAVRVQQDRIKQEEQRFKSAVALAEGLSPYAVLSRGFAMPSINGVLLRSVRDANVGDKMILKMNDGTLHSVIEAIEDA